MKTGITSLPGLLEARAAERPEAPFLFFREQTWTRAELWGGAQAAARELSSAGVGRGDRVALLLPNGPEFILYYFAVMRLGAVAVPINLLLKPPEIVFILKDSGAKGLVLGPAHEPLAEGIMTQCPSLKFTLAPGAGETKEGVLASVSRRGKEGAPLPAPPGKGEIASIIYTSGTTGFPKGAVLTHGAYLADTDMAVEAIGMSDQDRFLCFLPLFHVNGQVVTLLCPLFSGGSMVLMEKFQPKDFFELLSRHRCTAFSGVPSVYGVLLTLPDAERYDLSSLKFCICGAAPMPVEVFERFEAKFKARIMEGFGLSEGVCVSSVNPPPPGRRKIGSIGLPLKGQPMKIVGDSGRELPVGEVGEIVVRGPNLMRGYWNNPEATAAALKDGWLHTGDLGSRDSDGYFFITGRKKEMIIRGGENIYPKEIEEALYRHPAVAEAAVVGLPDQRWGEEVAAFIVLREGQKCAGRDLKRFLKENIADFKVPRRYEFVESLPKTATGKIQKVRLREKFAAAAKEPKRNPKKQPGG